MITIKAVSYNDEEDSNVIAVSKTYQGLVVQLIEGLNNDAIDTENYELQLEEDEEGGEDEEE